MHSSSIMPFVSPYSQNVNSKHLQLAWTEIKLNAKTAGGSGGQVTGVELLGRYFSILALAVASSSRLLSRAKAATAIWSKAPATIQ